MAVERVSSTSLAFWKIGLRLRWKSLEHAAVLPQRINPDGFLIDRKTFPK
jgi:hypothetical protein